MFTFSELFHRKTIRISPENLEHDASNGPHVHLVRVEPVGEKALWRAVPKGNESEMEDNDLNFN